MPVPELVLAYIEVLRWPVVVGAVVVGFRKQIASKISSLKHAKTAVAEASFFEQGAQAAETKAGEATERQPSALLPEHPPVDTDGERPDDRVNVSPPADHQDADAQPPPEEGYVTTPPSGDYQASDDHRYAKIVASALETMQQAEDFELARKVALSDPNAAVMSAYRQLEYGMRAVSDALEMQLARGSVVVHVAQDLGALDPEFIDVAREVTQLRNSVTHATTEVSLPAALSYIAACERLFGAVYRVTVSKLRHPSRSQRLKDLI